MSWPDSHFIRIYIDPSIPKDIQIKAAYVFDGIFKQLGYKTQYMDNSTEAQLFYLLNPAIDLDIQILKCNPEQWGHPPKKSWDLASSQSQKDLVRDLFCFISDEFQAIEEQNKSSEYLDKHGRINAIDLDPEIPQKSLQRFIEQYCSFIAPNEPVSNSILLSFDIDNLWVGWKGLIYRKMKGARFLSIQSLKNEQQIFIQSVEKIIDLLDQYGFKAVFFLKSLVEKPHQYDARDYLTMNQTQSLIDKIKYHEGIECGYHSSYKASQDIDLFQRELHRLETILDQKIRIHRAHYLRFSHLATHDILLKNGITFDSSIGWSAKVGSKSGLLTNYPLFHYKTNQVSSLQEIPLTFMDAQVCTRSDQNIDQIYKMMEQQLQDLRTWGHLISWDFHHLIYDTLLNPKNAPVFEQALKLLKQYSIQTVHSHEIHS